MHRERLVPTEVGWARPLRDNEEEFPFNKTMTRNHKATLGALGEGEISKRNQILTSRPTSAELSHAGRMTPPHPPHSNVPLMATPVRHAEHLQKSSQKLRSAYNWGARPQTPTTAQGNPSTGKYTPNDVCLWSTSFSKVSLGNSELRRNATRHF